MEAEIINMGFISIIPALIAIVLSFATRNTIVSLVVACIVGTLLSGQGLLGFPTLLKTSLGTTSFSWVMLLNTFASSTSSLEPLGTTRTEKSPLPTLAAASFKSSIGFVT